LGGVEEAGGMDQVRISVALHPSSGRVYLTDGRLVSGRMTVMMKDQPEERGPGTRPVGSGELGFRKVFDVPITAPVTPPSLLVIQPQSRRELGHRMERDIGTWVVLWMLVECGAHEAHLGSTCCKIVVYNIPDDGGIQEIPRVAMMDRADQVQVVGQGNFLFVLRRFRVVFRSSNEIIDHSILERLDLRSGGLMELDHEMIHSHGAQRQEQRVLPDVGLVCSNETVVVMLESPTGQTPPRWRVWTLKESDPRHPGHPKWEVSSRLDPCRTFGISTSLKLIRASEDDIVVLCRAVVTDATHGVEHSIVQFAMNPFLHEASTLVRSTAIRNIFSSTDCNLSLYPSGSADKRLWVRSDCPIFLSGQNTTAPLNSNSSLTMLRRSSVSPDTWTPSATTIPNRDQRSMPLRPSIFSSFYRPEIIVATKLHRTLYLNSGYDIFLFH